jgi:hypothetical protein
MKRSFSSRLLPLVENSALIESTRKVRLWTDDYSNLLQILK